MRISETTLFLKEAFTSPRQMGALLPSSCSLATAMAESLPIDRSSYILELGPGTGKVTEALLAQGMTPSHLMAIERSKRLSHHLRARFPGVCVLTGDAFALEHLIATQNPPAGMLDAVISSLPLKNFARAKVDAFWDAVTSVLRPGGLLVQYSYHIHSHKFRTPAPLKFEQSRIVWANLPPARIYVYRNDTVESFAPEHQEEREAAA